MVASVLLASAVLLASVVAWVLQVSAVAWVLQVSVVASVLLALAEAKVPASVLAVQLASVAEVLVRTRRRQAEPAQELAAAVVQPICAPAKLGYA